ncbi:hypothetical protein [Ekhidna sp.]|uniref:hypothetical protein n=1 Tax=Ekhidna sp. TaxID=2608089 RepID=UPI003B511533
MSKGKFPIYFFIAIVFLGLAKLLQVAVFDADKYKKSKEKSFSKNNKVAKTITKEPKKTESLKDTLTVSTQTEIISDTLKVEELEAVQTENNSEPSTSSFEGSNNSYKGLSDLKNTYLAPIIANLPSGQLREDLVIRYYRHDQDGDKVFSLKKLGYYIHEKEATETAGLGSNVIYYGDDVSIEDIQIVAYTLIDEGLPLKSIQPTSFNWKSNAIEIGTDPDLDNYSNLTAEDISNFRK